MPQLMVLLSFFLSEPSNNEMQSPLTMKYRYRQTMLAGNEIKHKKEPIYHIYSKFKFFASETNPIFKVLRE